MKQPAKIISFVSIILFAVNVHAQNPIELLDDEETSEAGAKGAIYYSFAKGDTIVFSFEVLQGTVSTLDIFEYPEIVKFQRKNFQGKVVKKIPVYKTNCYGFYSSNDSLCKYRCNITRIPGSVASQGYNTEVKMQKETVPLIEPIETVEWHNVTPQVEVMTLKSSSTKYNMLADGGNDRLTRTYHLPEGTLYWIYTLQVDNTKLDQEKADNKLLFDQLQDSKVPSDFKLAGEAILLLTKPPQTGFSSDFFVLDSDNSCRAFLQHNDANWLQYSDYAKRGTQSVSDIVGLPNGNKVYLGFRNMHSYDDIKIVFEVVAAVKKVKYNDEKQVAIFDPFE
jgi:hypothetical protein